jgi:hypothetical protein
MSDDNDHESDSIEALDKFVRHYSDGYFHHGWRVRWMVDHIEKTYPPSPERDAHLAAAWKVLADRPEEDFTIKCLEILTEKYCYEGLQGAEFSSGLYRPHRRDSCSSENRAARRRLSPRRSH